MRTLRRRPCRDLFIIIILIIINEKRGKMKKGRRRRKKKQIKKHNLGTFPCNASVLARFRRESIKRSEKEKKKGEVLIGEKRVQTVSEPKEKE